MSFQTRLVLLEPAETCETLEAAAWERYWDGFDLATSPPNGRYTGALYLLGYVAEMVLKVGFFRTVGTRPGAPVQLTQIRNHVAWTRNANLHHLTALTNLLVEVRRQRGNPLDPVFAGILATHAMTLSRHWQETIRYRQTMANEPELAEVFRSAEWILSNRETLWR